jgi:hypothetical protein
MTGDRDKIIGEPYTYAGTPLPALTRKDLQGLLSAVPDLQQRGMSGDSEFWTRFNRCQATRATVIAEIGMTHRNSGASYRALRSAVMRANGDRDLVEPCVDDGEDESIREPLPQADADELARRAFYEWVLLPGGGWYNPIRPDRPGPGGPDRSSRLAEWRSVFADGAAEGERNMTLASVAGYLFRMLDPFIARDLAHAWNASCDVPLPYDEAERTIRSIAKAELERRQGRRR